MRFYGLVNGLCQFAARAAVDGIRKPLWRNRPEAVH
jgi:hypothetical protein